MTLRKKNFVLPITTTSDKEGWLKKGKQLHKQQKRYFVLKDTSLAWFASQNGKIKGSIDVRNFHIVPIGNDTDDEYSFEVIPLEDEQTKKTKSKTYWLTGKTREVKDWIDAIRVAKRIVVSPPLSPKTSETHSAWLVKKGLKRWFVLKDDILYWYSKELAPDSEFFKNTQENGHIELGIGCSAFISKKETFTIRTSTADTYVMTANSEQEADDWVSWINKSIKSATIKKREIFENSVKTGVLLKKGKNRFFVLNNKQLYWFPSQKEYVDNVKERGCIVLHGCEITRVGKSTFSIVTAAPQPLAVYEFIGGSENETDEWVRLLQSAVANSSPLVNDSESTQAQGWLSKKGKKRYFILTSDVLIWFTEIPGEKKSTLTWPQLREAMSYNTNSSVGSAICKGNITLSGCSIGLVSPEVLSIVNSTGKAYHLEGNNKVLERWLQVLVKAQVTICKWQFTSSKSLSMDTQKSGFLLKKNKLRWFLAVNGILMWFEKEQNLTTSKHAKGSVSLSGSTVVHGLTMTGDPNSFMLSTKKGTTYILTASTKEDAESWVAILKRAITSANKTYSSDKSGWLQKESSKLNVKGRYFILKNNILMWFTSSGQLDNMKVKGAIQLAGCSVTLDEALYVKTSQGKRYKLLGSSEELSGWFKALEEAIVRANQETESSFVCAKKNYSSLKDLVLGTSLVIPLTFTQIYQSDDGIAHLVHLFYMENKHMSLLQGIVERELHSSGNIQESTLFRGDSVATKAVRAYFRIVALEWLQETLTPMIASITQHPNESFEVDPKKCQPNDNIPQNEKKLAALTLTFLETILNSFHKFPNHAKEFLSRVKQLVIVKFPNSKTTVVAGFVFLRFIVPCLFSPEGFDLNLEKPPSQTNRRTLVLIAKILQNIANGVLFQKEEYMLCFNPLIEQQRPRVADALDKISEKPTNIEILSEASIKTKQRTMAVVLKYLQDCQNLINKEVLRTKDPQKIEPFKKLYTIVLSE